MVAQSHSSSSPKYKIFASHAPGTQRKKWNLAVVQLHAQEQVLQEIWTFIIALCNMAVTADFYKKDIGR